MQNGELRDDVLSASSQYNAYAGPQNARLHFCAESGRYGAWIAQTQDHRQYYQVDFETETLVTRIETQGRQDSLQYVKEYTLRYSIDGSFFKHYQPSGHTKVRCFFKVQWPPTHLLLVFQRQMGSIVPFRYFDTSILEFRFLNCSRRTFCACNTSLSLIKVAFYILFAKTFKANSDRYTVVGHDLEKPIRTRYLRIIPEEWYGYIALRAEFYGCKTSKMISLLFAFSQL